MASSDSDYHIEIGTAQGPVFGDHAQVTQTFIESQSPAIDLESEYFNKMDEMIASVDKLSFKKLFKSYWFKEDEDLLTIKKAQDITLRILPGLDKAQKRKVLLYLYKSRLIFKDKTIINLCEFLNPRGGADLSGADLSGVNLQRANLGWVNLSEANLNNANLSEASLHDANLSEANLNGANLNEASLHDANLSWADLRDANLGSADLSDASLFGADLRGAKLTGRSTSTGFSTSLCNADLRGANLRGATLILSEAILGGDSYGAFYRALYGALLSGAQYNTKEIPLKDEQGNIVYELPPTLWPEGFDPKAHGAIENNTDRKYYRHLSPFGLTSRSIEQKKTTPLGEKNTL